MEMGVERALKKYLPNGAAATRTEVPQLRTGNPYISGGMSYLHIMRHLKMRIKAFEAET